MFSEKDLKELIGPETIVSVNFTQTKAEVTFKSLKLAQRALIIDGVPINGSKLSVTMFCPPTVLK